MPISVWCMHRYSYYCRTPMEKGPAGFWKGNLTKASTSQRLCNHHPLKRHLGLGQDFISLCVTHSNQDQTDCDTLGKSSTIQMNYEWLFITLLDTQAICLQIYNKSFLTSLCKLYKEMIQNGFLNTESIDFNENMKCSKQGDLILLHSQASKDRRTRSFSVDYMTKILFLDMSQP